MSSAAGSYDSARKPSIDPPQSIICFITQTSATRSGPRVHRCTTGANAAFARAGSNART